MTTQFPVNPAALRKLAAHAAMLGALAALCALPSILSAQTATSILPLPPQTVSTVPSNGDVNPYGVAFVPREFPNSGVLQPFDLLVSNYNNSANLQGTGTTIVRVDGHGHPSLFFQGQSGLGLTAALGVLRAGFVIVGNLPTTDGTSGTAQAGSLLFIDRNGRLVGTISNTQLVNGPWGLAINDQGSTAQIFVSNVLAGTVTRLDLALTRETVQFLDAVQVASGYNHRPDPAALLLGPSGLAYDPTLDLLYVASSADNAVYAIPNAGASGNNSGTGTLIYQDLNHLHGPIDIARTPNGDLVVANSDGSNVDAKQPSELVEFTPQGGFVTQSSVDPENGGAFGVAVMRLIVGGTSVVRSAAVDDVQNTVIVSWSVN